MSLAVLLGLGGCGFIGKLLGGDDTKARTEQKLRNDEQAAKQREQDEALQAEIQAVWAEIDEQGITAERAMSLAGLTEKAFSSGAVDRGSIDGAGLGTSTLTHIDEAIAAEPDALADLALAKGSVHALTGDRDAAAAAYAESFEARPDKQTFVLLLGLGLNPTVSVIVVDLCPKIRPEITDDEVPDFIEACLTAAGGNTAALEWKGVKKDLVAHRQEMDRRAEEARIRAEEERIRAEEEARAAEEARLAAAEEARKMAQYTVAAVFAAGSCSFGDCMHKGWEIRTDEGTIRATCNFGECLEKGWETRFPSGETARTSCNFGSCMEKGWETRFPSGETARTSCNFGECATKGWETRLPDGSTARTSCNFGECYIKGWETRLPDGSTVRCSCKFGECLEKGTECR
ncbi:MAG: hypothetical protein AAF799_25050 [Myxococcota bacterium]